MKTFDFIDLAGLNPCFNGRYSLSKKKFGSKRPQPSLNPCFNGRYSLSSVEIPEALADFNGLNPCFNGRYSLSGNARSISGL